MNLCKLLQLHCSHTAPLLHGFRKQIHNMKIAIIGQSVFGARVLQELQREGHNIVGVFTVPDRNGRVDQLAAKATEIGSPVFKVARWRQNNKLVEDVFANYLSVGAELNVLAFCTQFIPMEVITAPAHRSIIYHPSLLPRHRGASAINWTLIDGDLDAGLTVFWADDGLDTGPILLQRRCRVEMGDTVDTLYSRFMMPVGVQALVDAVNLIEAGRADSIPQHHTDMTYDPIVKKSTAEINWDQSGMKIHNFIRGHDKVPGAWGWVNEQQVTFYGSQLWYREVPHSEQIQTLAIRGLSEPAILHSQGLLIRGSDNQWVNVSQLKFEDSGKTIQANKYNQVDELLEMSDMNDEETQMETAFQAIWRSILMGSEIEPDSDFFKLGASSMDVTRLLEEVKCAFGVELPVEDVYVHSAFEALFRWIIVKRRGGGQARPLEYDPVTIAASGMSFPVPHQLFINNEFVDSESGKTFETRNPTDESVICRVSYASVKDVDRAVAAAHQAFEFGDWGKMSARDRGRIMYRLADLMEAHKEQLAVLEALDSGALYTLALKTHVGMSIDTFRYFAGWCDKIHGSVIPISHARPNKDLSFTKKEPIGVCGIITPWNYPLMMLAWKMAACLAAGNTVVLKPAQVTPLTALKFCELSVAAGFPAGVINVLPGSGALAGKAISEHRHVRKLGFTGSTEVGQTIMTSCAKSNLKKCSLELGGKSPLIIFSDCDMDKAVKSACNSVFFNKGENCIAAGRIFVDIRIHDSFLSLVLDEVRAMKIGDPLDRSVDHGPQNHEAHLNKLLEYCNIGQKEGARLVIGGKRCNRPGYFMEPTVFTDVTDDMYIAKEESFGPVMIISTFHDIDEVVVRANRTEYGLAAGVFTSDVSKALRVSDAVDAGTVFVNTYNKTDVAAPFGGFKQSGFGKDLGQEALNEYLKTKSIIVEY